MSQGTWTVTFWPTGQAAQIKTGNLLRILSESDSRYHEENLPYCPGPRGLSHNTEEQGRQADELQSLLMAGHPQNQGS